MAYYAEGDQEGETYQDVLLSLTFEVESGDIIEETYYAYDEEAETYGELTADPGGDHRPRVAEHRRGRHRDLGRHQRRRALRRPAQHRVRVRAARVGHADPRRPQRLRLRRQHRLGQRPGRHPVASQSSAVTGFWSGPRPRAAGQTDRVISIEEATRAVDTAQKVVDQAIAAMSAQGGPDSAQVLAYDVAHAAAALDCARAALEYATHGPDELAVAGVFVGDALAGLQAVVAGRESDLGSRSTVVGLHRRCCLPAT